MVNAGSLSEVRHWAEGLQVDPTSLNFVTAKVTVGAFAATLDLFWPRFELHRNCVIVDWAHDAKLFEQWWEKLDGDRSGIEKVLNHLHLWDVFETGEPTEERMLEQILERLAVVWPLAAKEQFPGREFCVSTSTDESDYGPTITIWSCGSAGDDDPSEGCRSWGER